MNNPVRRWPGRMIHALGGWLTNEYLQRANMIGGVDNLFLLVSELAPDFNPVCAAVYTFEKLIQLEDLEIAALNMAEQFPKYKSRLTALGKKLHSPSFEPDPLFDVKTHVSSTTLPHPAGKKELESLMGRFIAKEWDIKRPLWEMLLVRNYHDEDGACCALLSRAHHTLADGQGFFLSQYYMTSYFDELQRLINRAAEKLEAARKGRLPPSQIHSSFKFLDRFTHISLTAPFIQIFMMAFFWIFTIVSGVISFFWSSYGGIRQIISYASTCWRVETLTAQYRGPRVREREFACTDVFSIDDVKLCQRAFSGVRPGSKIRKSKTGRIGSKSIGHLTLNDVVCAVMVDAAEGVLQENNQRGSGPNRFFTFLKRTLPTPVGFFIPISLRQPGDWTLRNQTTGAVAFLEPSKTLSNNVSIRELHKHMHACRRELSFVKHSVWPTIIFEILQVAGQVPAAWPLPFAFLPRLLSASVSSFVQDWITAPIVRLLLESVPIIFTNVPGPTTPLEICGSRVIKWCALPPQAGKGTLGIGVISYNGGLCVSVAADSVDGTKNVARRLCERFEERFKIYVERAREVVEQH